MASHVRAADDDYMMGSVRWRIFDDERNVCISDRYQPLSLFLNLSASQTQAFPERNPAKNEKRLVPNSITPRLSRLLVLVLVLQSITNCAILRRARMLFRCCEGSLKNLKMNENGSGHCFTVCLLLFISSYFISHAERCF